MPTNLNCANLTNSEWTTTTFDDQKCIEYENDAGSMCLECNQCKTSSLYSSDSPYYLYSVKMYDDIEEKEKYCSPSKMKENINSDVMD